MIYSILRLAWDNNRAGYYSTYSTLRERVGVGSRQYIGTYCFLVLLMSRRDDLFYLLIVVHTYIQRSIYLFIDPMGGQASNAKGCVGIVSSMKTIRHPHIFLFHVFVVLSRPFFLFSHDDAPANAHFALPPTTMQTRPHSQRRKGSTRTHAHKISLRTRSYRPNIHTESEK